MEPYNDSELFFITEAAEAEMIAAGYRFELPPIACTARLSTVLEGLSDAELRWQRREVTNPQRE